MLNHRNRGKGKIVKRLTPEFFRSTELVFWPFVLVVGKAICDQDLNTKHKFWRDHAIMCFFIVGPATILEMFKLDPNPIIYALLLGIGTILYVAFIFKWRSFLKGVTTPKT